MRPAGFPRCEGSGSSRRAAASPSLPRQQPGNNGARVPAPGGHCGGRGDGRMDGWMAGRSRGCRTRGCRSPSRPRPRGPAPRSGDTQPAPGSSLLLLPNEQHGGVQLIPKPAFPGPARWQQQEARRKSSRCLGGPECKNSLYSLMLNKRSEELNYGPVTFRGCFGFSPADQMYSPPSPSSTTAHSYFRISAVF